MKILCLTDIHLTHKKPRSYSTPDFLKVQLDLLTWVWDRADAKKVDCIISGGDVFDHWGQMPIQQFSKVLNCFNTGLPFLSCYGNHDIPASYDLRNETALHALSSLPNIYLTSSQHTLDWHPLDWGSDEWSHFQKTKEFLVDSKVCSLHYAVSEKGDFGAEKIDSWANTLVNSPELILVGDRHSGWDTRTFKDKYGEKVSIINPGSFSKLKSDEREQRCQICIATRWGKRNWSFEYIKVPWPVTSEPVKTRLTETIQKINHSVSILPTEELIKEVGIRTKASNKAVDTLIKETKNLCKK